jgi:hypothetical protein
VMLYVSVILSGCGVAYSAEDFAKSILLIDWRFCEIDFTDWQKKAREGTRGIFSWFWFWFFLVCFFWT